MWKLSNYLKAALERSGFSVALTRAENEDPSLSARGEKAKGADLFISEHSNAANGTARGVEVYYSVQEPGDKSFAAALSKAVSELMGNPDRGAKTRRSTDSASVDYYTVMASARRAGCPHVLLIESGFHDNAQDEAFLKVDANLQTIAETQANVIRAYLSAETNGQGGTQMDISGQTTTINGNPIMGDAVLTADQLTEYLLSRNPSGDIILDTCMGSGTTAAAALETGRFFTGFETDERYYRLANERVQKVTDRTDTEFSEELCLDWAKEKAG